MTAMTGDPMHTMNAMVNTSATITGKRLPTSTTNELFEQGAAELDETKRAEIYAELQAYDHDNAYHIPLFQQIITYGVRDYIENFEPDAGLQLDCKGIVIN